MKQLEDETWERLVRAAKFYEDKLKQEINVPAPAVKARRKRNTVAGRKGSSYVKYLSPSPRTGTNEPPYKRTGHLQRGITTRRDRPKMRIRVGIVKNVEYGLFLELHLKRLWIVATLKKFQAQIGAHATAKSG